MASTVSGTIFIEGSPAARQVVAISHRPFLKNGVTARHVVGASESSGVDGRYEIVLDTGFHDDVIVIALDEYGEIFQPDTAYGVGDVMRPTAGNENGHVYQCTVAGTTGASEPSWWIDTGANDTQAVGTATFAAHKSYRPLAHAPIYPVGVAPDPPPAELQFNYPGLILAYTMDNTVGAQLIDETVNEINSTIVGAFQVSGASGNALSFSNNPTIVDVANSYCQLQQSVILGPDFGLSCIFRSPLTKDTEVIVGSSGGDYITLKRVGGLFSIRVGINSTSYIGPDIIAEDGQLHLLIVSRNGQTGQLTAFIDDTKVQWAGNTGNVTIDYIGTWTTASVSSHAVSDVDRLRLYGEQITDAMAADLYAELVGFLA